MTRNPLTARERAAAKRGSVRLYSKLGNVVWAKRVRGRIKL